LVKKCHSHAVHYLLWAAFVLFFLNKINKKNKILLPKTNIYPISKVFTNTKFPRGNYQTNSYSWNINTPLSLLFTTKFNVLPRASSKNHLELFSTILDESRDS